MNTTTTNASVRLAELEKEMKMMELEKLRLEMEKLTLEASAERAKRSAELSEQEVRRAEVRADFAELRAKRAEKNNQILGHSLLYGYVTSSDGTYIRAGPKPVRTHSPVKVGQTLEDIMDEFQIEPDSMVYKLATTRTVHWDQCCIAIKGKKASRVQAGKHMGAKACSKCFNF
jgi:hypothetical protein